MSCYHLKGGIGSASRVFEIGGQTYTLGALAMTNFGSLIDLTIAGERIGKKACGGAGRRQGLVHHGPGDGRAAVFAAAVPGGPAGPERPCAHRRGHRARQRRDRARLLHGQPHPGGQIFHSGVYLNDEAFRPIFRAATETVEESIIRSMLEAETVTGRDGHIRLSLHDAMERAGLPR